MLEQIHPSPVVTLNRSVAVSKVHGPQAAGVQAVVEVNQTDVREYFVSGRTVPWCAVTGSIVAT